MAPGTDVAGPLAGRMVLVTGATAGSLGCETARQLLALGAGVVVTTRSDPAGAVAALGSAKVTGHELELSDRASVRAFARWFTDTHDHLDILVNNAGIHLDLRSSWKQPHLVDGHEIHWRTNYLGTVQLTRALLPLLIDTAARTGQARVVNVASKLHARGRNEFLFGPIEPYNSWAAYGTSKLGLIHEATELARRHGPAGLRAYSLHPGSVYTHIADRGLEEHRVLSVLRRVARPLERRALTSAAEGARTSVLCATDDGATSGYYRDRGPAETSPDARDASAAWRLWEQTDRWLATV